MWAKGLHSGNIIHPFPSSMLICFPHSLWATQIPVSHSPIPNSLKTMVPQEMFLKGLRLACSPLLLCRKLGVFQVRTGIQQPFYSAPSKPLLEAEPLTSSQYSPELQHLLRITQIWPPTRGSSSPDKLSLKLLRSLLLELFNGIINLLLTFGIILIKTVLCMYY